jgi:endonuclease/exonuclease/phosphatase family protein
MARRMLSCVFALLLAAACGDQGSPTTAPDGAFLASFTPAASQAPLHLTVMTRNLYIGADVDVVIGALASPDPSDDFPALLAAIAVLQETDWPTRVGALADEIARARPHAVGLQEVEELTINLTGFGIPVNISQDFLAMLQNALADRGLTYAVAGQVTNVTAAPIPGISLVDKDVLLIDLTRVSVAGPVVAQNFTFNIGPVAPGVVLKRGWVQAPVTIGGLAVTIVDTHLESGPGAALSGLRAAQAAELVGSVGGAPAAILLGDFNDTPGSPMHGAVTGAGFADAWTVLRPGAVGLTCCHFPNLANLLPDFDQRIDYVFVRGLAGPRGSLQGQVSIIGNQPADRVAGPVHPVWPSDHAGVIGTVLLPSATP